MGKCLVDIGARTQPIWTGNRWRRLAGEILLLAAFVMTSSWLIKP
jgi:hypothetical protein